MLCPLLLIPGFASSGSAGPSISITLGDSFSTPVLGRVRLYLATALQRLPLDQRWDLAAALVSHEADKDDHNLPLMYWYGIEPLVPTNKVRALQLAAKAKIPLIRQYIARRSASK